MKIARDKYGRTFIAEESTNFHAPFFCIGCKSKLSLHNHSDKKHNFFAHLPGEHCYYADEPQELTFAKINIYKSLKNIVDKIELEKYIHGFKSEILFTIDGKQVSINFFNYKTSVEYIRNKTEKYSQNDIYSFWVIPSNIFKKRVIKNQFYALESDLFIQSLYYKKIFLWDNKNYFTPVSLDYFRSYNNKKVNKIITICNIIFFKSRPLKAFFPKDEKPFNEKQIFRKIFTTYINFKKEEKDNDKN